MQAKIPRMQKCAAQGSLRIMSNEESDSPECELSAHLLLLPANTQQLRIIRKNEAFFSERKGGLRYESEIDM